MSTDFPFAVARGISPDSWLNQTRFEWFRKGYDYAASHTRSIPALSQVSPEDLYFAVTQIMHGAGIKEPKDQK